MVQRKSVLGSAYLDANASRDNGQYREDYNLELISSKELNFALLTSSTAAVYFTSGGSEAA